MCEKEKLINIIFIFIKKKELDINQRTCL